MGFLDRGARMTALEIAANAVTAVSIWLAARNSRHTWTTGIVGCILFAVQFYRVQLYADVTLQVFFIATSLVGWWHWRRASGEAVSMEQPVTRASRSVARIPRVRLRADGLSAIRPLSRRWVTRTGCSGVQARILRRLRAVVTTASCSAPPTSSLCRMELDEIRPFARCSTRGISQASDRGGRLGSWPKAQSPPAWRSSLAGFSRALRTRRCLIAPPGSDRHEALVPISRPDPDVPQDRPLRQRDRSQPRPLHTRAFTPRLASGSGFGGSARGSRGGRD